MNYSIVTGDSSVLDGECLIVAVPGARLGPSASKLDRQFDCRISQAFSASGLDNKQSGCEAVYLAGENPRLVVIVQLGEKSSIDFTKFRKGMTQALGSLHETKRLSALFCISDAMGRWCDTTGFYQSIVQLCELSTYQYVKTRRPVKNLKSLTSIRFLEPLKKRTTRATTGIDRGRAVGRGMNLCREIADLPANICTPDFLAGQAMALAGRVGIETTILDERDAEKLGMGCFLGVARGSAEPARFIVMKYKGTDPGVAPIVLIGKGITFDSGGISIKSAPAMDEMKFDMCGASSVLGIMQSVAQMKLAVNITGIIPACENMLDGGAFKPGDVLVSMSGQTVEILSTDAEGRLVMADALSYAERFQPAIVIDIATLTGACITALGYEISGLMANNQTLANKIAFAAKQSHDHVWQLPLWEGYHRHLDSNFADMASSAGRSGNAGAGAIVAACFLSRFAKQFRWAHLDVAGTAWLRGDDKGATGRPVGLICQFIINYCLKPF